MPSNGFSTPSSNHDYIASSTLSLVNLSSDANAASSAFRPRIWSSVGISGIFDPLQPFSLRSLLCSIPLQLKGGTAAMPGRPGFPQLLFEPMLFWRPPSSNDQPGPYALIAFAAA